MVIFFNCICPQTAGKMSGSLVMGMVFMMLCGAARGGCSGGDSVGVLGRGEGGAGALMAVVAASSL